MFGYKNPSNAPFVFQMFSYSLKCSGTISLSFEVNFQRFHVFDFIVLLYTLFKNISSSLVFLSIFMSFRIPLAMSSHKR